MAELKSFFNDVSKNAADRETYNHEFHELQVELNNLRSQKFNGVSLFATYEPDNNPLKIITSDDGLGEHIELSRTGLFENLKSKFGADWGINIPAPTDRTVNLLVISPVMVALPMQAQEKLLVHTTKVMLYLWVVD